MTIQKRAQEIEKSIIDDTIHDDAYTGLESFLNFITSKKMSNEEIRTLHLIIKATLSAPFSDRHNPINTLVRRSILWQAERLARLEQE